MQSQEHAGGARRRHGGAATAAVALVSAALVFSGVQPARAEGPSQLSLEKTASTSSVAPGETFSYELQVGCSAIDVGVGCTNAVLTDPVPDEFEVVDVGVGAGLSAETPTIDGNTVTVVFNSPLTNPVGSVGMLASASGVVTITVQARDDLPYEADGVAVDNTATLDASNAIEPAVSTDTVTPSVPLDLVARTAKQFTPRTAVAAPGTPTELAIGVRNDSNAGVTSMVLTDPDDPLAGGNPFALLAVTGLGDVDFPAGADQVEVEVWTGSWVSSGPAATAALPAGVDLEAITGLRFTFTNSAGGTMAPGEIGRVEIELEQRDEVLDLTAATSVNNSVTGSVGLDGETASVTGRAQYRIATAAVTIGASKSIEPAEIVAGDSATVTVGASNLSATTLNELVITEPTPTSDRLFDDGFTEGIAFTGFTDALSWPEGATAATVHYYYADETDEELAADAVDTLPPPTAGESVVRFVVTFTGAMGPGANAQLGFTVQTDPDITNTSVVIENSMSATGRTPTGAEDSADAADTLTVYAERLAMRIGKSVSPSQILSNPGEFILVQLPARLAPFPISTIDAHLLIVQDPPGTPPGATDWWNHFNATAITQTAVPVGATLTVRYWNGSSWIVLPGAQGIAGPTIFSVDIDPALQEVIQGLRFTFESADGFPPGTSVQPNVTMTLRDQLRDGTGPAAGEAETVENCAASAAITGILTATATTPQPCPLITLVPGDFPGGTDFLSKSWVGPQVITARTGDEVSALLSWSTGGRSNISPMVISDVADPSTTPVADSVFDAFDLVAVPAISATQDPLLKYDQVQSVEFFTGTTWVRAAADPCPAACDGTFPGVTLTAAEQASTTGVRLSFVESPTRATTIIGDPTGPPVGSGVARSIGNDRGLPLRFRLRDDVRAPVTTPDPVVGTRVYNTGEAGAVENTARATGTSTIDGSQVTDTAADTIRILDVPLNVDVSKEWTGGPIGIPQAGTDPSLYPTTRVGVTATNRTAASVDELVITDPGGPDPPRPFDFFTLTDLLTISVPAGATGTTVTLQYAGGGSDDFSREAALALTAAQLTEVVGIEVRHTGRIDAGATASLRYDVRLRATDRSDDSPVTAADSPVANTAEAEVSDEGGAPGGDPTDLASASLALVAGTISVTAEKSLTPASQTEPDRSPVVLRLAARPGGSVRTATMTVTDEAGTFWNAFDYVGLASPIALAAPIDRVRIDACVGRSFTDPAQSCLEAGGAWVTGISRTAAEANAAPLPAAVTPAQVAGLRFVFTRADGAGFENPADPLQTVSVSVQRRTDLRSGGPVPSDLAGNTAAPGEAAPGQFSDTARADVVGTIDDGGAPFTANNSASAEARYLHASTSVAVSKSPSGVRPPGSIIPYQLRVTNNGAIALTDPVIVDELPTDASGPLLVFDPFADPAGPGPYSYALTGAAPSPASGPAMPTSTADVDEVVGDGGATITFRFPAGTVLEVGQSYTITVQLMFRTGLAASTAVTNTFGVTGDRPFDGCSGTLDPVTGACETSTTVTVQVAGALRGIKSVRADDDSLGIRNLAPEAECLPDADGFWAGQCVPITLPGGTETWRLTLINTGTLAMDRMVAIDRLPVVGDTGALANLPRGSEFRTPFTGDAALARGPAGAVLSLYATTAANPCVADLNTTGAGCPAGSWTPWSPSSDPAAVTSIKAVIDFPTPIPPGGSVAVDLGTRTPGSAPGAPVEPIAWNTVAVGGRVLNAGVPGPTASTEGNKVGVALATGAVSVLKVVEGAGAAFAPESFTGEVTCESAGEAVPAIPVELVPGTPVEVDGLPLGAECTFAENDSGQTSWEATTVTVTSDAGPPVTITVTNVFDLAGLRITKTVDSTAVDQEGQPIYYGPFAVAAACEFLDEPVYADGYSAQAPMQASLDSGESLLLTGLPAGATCVVDETGTRGATQTTVESATGAVTTAPVEGTSTEVTLTPDAVAGVTNAVGFVNSFESAPVRIEKVVTGPGAAEFGAGPFEIALTCVLADETGERTVWDGTVSLGGADPLETTVENLPTGATCSAVETATAGATTSTVTPDELTVGDDAELGFTVTNDFAAGSLRVVKEREGEGAGLYGTGPFAVVLTCVQRVDGTPQRVTIPGGALRALTAANGYQADYLLLPAGATCVLAEPARGGATGSRILDEAGQPAGTIEVGPGSTATLTVVNTFPVGSVIVTKTLEGADADAHRDSVFTVDLACTLNVNGVAREVLVPGGSQRQLGDSTGFVAEYTALPTGARCELTETSSDGASAVTITPDDGVVVIADSSAVDITVTNRFDPDPSSGGVGDSGVLPFTGTDVDVALIAAVMLLLAGVVLLAIGRRSRGH